MIKPVFFKNPPPLIHLKRLTTPLGLLQHTEKETPDPAHGYSLDDNARALIVALKYAKIYLDLPLLNLAQIYLDYLKRAQLKDGRFHNFLSFGNKFTDRAGSEDSFGEVIWALGYAISHPEIDQAIKKRALRIFQKAKKQIKNLKFLRGRAYTLLGLYYVMDKKGVKKLADSLILDYKRSTQQNWHWFENILTYANGLLPYALFLAYDLLKDKKYLKIGQESLDFLDKVCRKDRIVVPIGNQGWFKKGREKALFDQQPIEPAMMVLAFSALFQITHNFEDKEKALDWFSWFYGNNLKNKKLLDQKTGGCFDGLTKFGANLNQGAESILSYLLAYLEFKEKSEI